MYLPPEERRIPHHWEPPKRDPEPRKRQGDAAVILILLVSALALFAPIAGGTVIGVLLAIARAAGATLQGH